MKYRSQVCEAAHVSDEFLWKTLTDKGLEYADRHRATKDENREYLGHFEVQYGVT